MLVDAIIILMIGMFTVVGFKKGVIQQVVMFVGTILVYILAFFLKNPVADILFRFCPFFRFWGKLEGLVVLNVIIYQLIAFVLVAGILFTIFGVILKITGILQKAVDLTLVLTLPSKLLGGLIGFLEGYIIVFIILTVFMVALKPLGIYDSFIAQNIIHNSPILSNSFSGIHDAIDDIFTLVGDSSDKRVSSNQMNNETMDTLLKYKVINVKSCDILLDNGKIDSIEGIDKTIDKYREE